MRFSCISVLFVSTRPDGARALLAIVSPEIVVDTLGGAFRDFYCLPANGARGGIILAWRSDHVLLVSPSIGIYHISATVSPVHGSTPWWITGVYGP